MLLSTPKATTATVPPALSPDDDVRTTLDHLAHTAAVLVLITHAVRLQVVDEDR